MKVIQYKNGVVRKGDVYYNGEWYSIAMNPERTKMEKIMNEVYNNLFSFPVTVTCIIGREHSKNSLHPKGFAEDFRTWTTPTSGVQMSSFTKKTIQARARALLGKGYDVVVEANHIHIEYDPK